MTDTLWEKPRGIGIFYNESLKEAADLAPILKSRIEKRGIDAWIAGGETDSARARAAESDLLICLGGDGTVLAGAHLLAGVPTMLFGINLGRLGFLTEIQAAELDARFDDVLAGRGRVEERSMVQATTGGHEFHALNDIVIGRARFGRSIQLAVDIDGTRIADYRCDAVIVATASGSTAYGLSVGGPILPPGSSDLVMVPVAPHLAANNALVFPSSETLRITLEPRQQGILTADGRNDFELVEGDTIAVTISPHKTRFLRLDQRTDFYIRMAARLGWHRPAGNAAPLPQAGTAK
jgi:NAD+ kinase